MKNNKSYFSYIFLISLLLFGIPFFVSAKANNYVLDKEHTSIIFSVEHLGFSNKIGVFTDYEGSFEFDEEQPENSKVSVIIRPKGVETFSKKLNEVLQEELWFNTKRYPEISFVSSKVIPYGENKAKVHGWLTFLGEKKFAKLDVTFNRSGKHIKTGNFIAGFSANTEIDRAKFGMKGGVPFIGSNVKIMIEAEGIKQ